MEVVAKQPGRIRVAIFADIAPDAVGGVAKGRGGGHAATWLPQIADAFSKESDFDVWWITFDDKVSEPACIDSCGQHFIRLPRIKLSTSLLVRHAFIRSRFRKLLNELDPDVIHTWGTERAYPAAMSVHAAPSILSMQGILTEYAKIGSLPKKWQWRLMAAMEPRWMRDATVVTSESSWGLEKVHRIVPGKETRMVEYGVHSSFYDLDWEPDTENPYALFCGGVDWRKGVDLLADAMAMNPEANWECRLAGEGSMRAELEARKVRGLRFLGNLPWAEMQEELRRASCLVLPTRADTSPNVVKEARVVGLPVVTTPHGGQAGYVLDGQNGFIVDPLDAEGLSRALRTLMETPGLIWKMGATRHEEDRSYLDAARTAEGFGRLYRELDQAR